MNKTYIYAITLFIISSALSLVLITKELSKINDNLSQLTEVVDNLKRKSR